MGWRRCRAADSVRVVRPILTTGHWIGRPLEGGERGIAAMKIDGQIGFVQCGFEGPEWRDK
jgi:hypothetical protein